MKRFLLNPFVVMLAAIQIVLLLLLKVVPTFNEVFKDFGSRLPWPTQVCVDVGNIFLNHQWLTFFPLPLGFFLAYLQTKKIIEVKWLKAWMVVLLLGLVIGFMIWAMFVPMFEFGNVSKAKQ